MIKELLRIDLREEYRDTFFADWEGRDLPAQHRFVPEPDGGVRMSFSRPGDMPNEAGLVIESGTGGNTWWEVEGWHPPTSRGIFEWQGKRMAVWGGTEFMRSLDSGDSWERGRIRNAGDLIYDGLEDPNCFSAILITQGIYAGRIVLVSDFFLGQEGPDGEVLASTYTDDCGFTWKTSKVFGAPDPLPAGPEGFGEPAVVQLPSGWLWMVFRSLYGELWQCVSRDGGATWGRPTPTGLVSPIANCYAVREPTTGATVLCWNAMVPGVGGDFRARHSFYRPRTNLVFSVSHDNTRTWTVPVQVEAEGGQYPTIHFAAGRMFIMYQSSPANAKVGWHEMGLTLVAYDAEEVLNLPAWTPQTIEPLIEVGLVRQWRAAALM